MNDKTGLLHLLGVDRLLYFTDALVAIAATLLVLPLVDAAGTYVKDHPRGTAGDFLGSEQDALLAFVISFLVIVRLWTAHHRLFSTVTAADTTLIWLDLAWGFTIVLLPLPTELTQLDKERGSVGFYVGTMLASSLLLLLIVLHVRRRSELREADRWPRLAPSVATSILFTVALVGGVLVNSYYPLLVLLAGGVLARVLAPRLDRHDTSA
jgi:uncharacterized membrane protein